MAASDADGHDLEKLARWQCSLRDEAPGPFAVHALFLVSPEDGAAHRAFRRFRSSFEARSASFRHLVIFGQHGVSATVMALASELGLGAGDTPVLVLFPGAPAGRVHILPLAPGEEDSPGVWEEVLSKLESWAGQGEGEPDLPSLPGVRQGRTRHRTVAGLAESVLAQLAPRGRDV